MSNVPDFAPYISQVQENTASGDPGQIKDWSALRGWLERVNTDEIQPTPERLPIIPPSLRQTIAAPSVAQTKRAGWEDVVESRRKLAMLLTIASVAMILYLTSETLAAEQMPVVTMCIYLAVYGVMTWFLAQNFFKLCIGTWHTLRGASANPWHPAHNAIDPRPGTRVAIIYPVYHEDVSRVAAGMAATWASLLRDHPDLADRFDNFLLSDSRKAEYWIAEQAAIQQLRCDFPGAKFFYRRRGSNLNAKMGNTVDFCRRWGRRYDYMVVMDADSVMSGDALVSLLRMMEGNERIGILQTNPRPILRKSLFGRMQQFAGQLYGSVFSYSLQAVHMGHASYIGHNAIIRMQPFVRHCILPELSGPAPWGGKPLSHDIVESALMARAGYEVWFLPEIQGSYEEVPANILSFLIRERRWMQGNLQHLRLLGLRGLRSTHRETFFNGAMGYMSAPLWAVFLVVSAYGMVHFLQSGMLGMSALGSLEVPMMMLLISSMVFLFMPRLLAIAINIEGSRARGFGGKGKLLASLFIETVFSFFFSPIVMVYITKFVWMWVKRRSISWGTQQRDDDALPWSDCINHFGWVAVVGVVAWGVIYQQTSAVDAIRLSIIKAVTGASPTDIMLWFFPILAGLSFSPMIVRFTSRSFPDLAQLGFFLIPEEVDPPAVLRDIELWEARLRAALPDPDARTETLAYAMTDVGFYVRHRPMTRSRSHVAAWLLPKILAGEVLSERETMFALSERACFDAIHERHVSADHTSTKQGCPSSNGLRQLVA